MKCFYHNDLDGRCAGSIVAKYYNNYNKDDFFEIDYVTPIPIDVIKNNEEVFFVDYSFKKNTVWQLKEIAKRSHVTWTDHHTDSMELEKTEGYEWLQYIDGLRVNGISGAALTYMYLYNCEFINIPQYIKHVSDYDCWKFMYEPDTTYFKLGIETVPDDALDQIWKVLSNNDDELIRIIDKGKIIKNYVDETNKYYLDHFGYESEIDGHKCYVVNQKTNSWIFGKKYNEYPLVCVWVFDGNKYSYSLYSSNKDTKCNKIAEKFGGGGHTGAAGFATDNLILLKK